MTIEMEWQTYIEIHLARWYDFHVRSHMWSSEEQIIEDLQKAEDPHMMAKLAIKAVEGRKRALYKLMHTDATVLGAPLAGPQSGDVVLAEEAVSGDLVFVVWPSYEDFIEMHEECRTLDTSDILARCAVTGVILSVEPNRFAMASYVSPWKDAG